MNYNAKVYKYLNISFAILIFIGFYYFVWMRVREEIPRFQSFRSLFPAVTPINFMLFASVFLLMFLNWSTEGIKNRFLISKFHAISFLQSLRIVLTGLSISLLFPNRVGDFLGRAVCMPGKRIETASAVLIGNFAQMITTLFFGLCGLSLSFLYQVEILSTRSFLLVFLLTLLVITICLTLYFNLKFLYFLLSGIKIRLIRQWLSRLSFISNYSKKELFKVLFLSVLRYSVFFLQFFLLMQLFSVPASPFYTFIFVSLFYLFLLVIPSWFITEIASRAGIGILLLSTILPGYDTKIVIISSLLWMINILLPAITGSFFSLRVRYFSK